LITIITGICLAFTFSLMAYISSNLIAMMYTEIIEIQNYFNAMAFSAAVFIFFYGFSVAFMSYIRALG